MKHGSDLKKEFDGSKLHYYLRDEAGMRNDIDIDAEFEKLRERLAVPRKSNGMRTKYIWDTTTCHKGNRRGTFILAEMQERDTQLRVVRAGDGYDVRIYESWKPALTKKLLHRSDGLESSILLAEDIYEAYKTTRDAKG